MKSIVYVSLFVARLVRCCWCISILIIIPVVRWYSFIGPQWSAVVLFDLGYSSLGNFDSIIPIDVVRMKSYMDSLFDPTCILLRVMINKLNLAPSRNMPRFVSVLRNHRGLSWSKPFISVMLFYPFSHWSPLFHRYTLFCIHMGSCKRHRFILFVLGRL